MQRADKRRYHYIYKITRDDGRYYIGMHSTNNVDDGYFGSGKLITRSIKKHGIEKHAKEILEYLPDRVSLKSRERQLITQEVVEDVLCMNLQLGGGGGFLNEAHQRKCAAAGGKAGGWKSMQIINRDPVVRAKVIKTRQQNGSLATCGMLGKKHSTSAKEQMSASGMGEKNSQFGSCWVTDGVKPIKIKKEQLDEYIQNGYSRGRK